MNFGVVIPNLLLGPCPCDLEDMENLKSQKVTAILSLQSEEDVEDREEGWARNLADAAGLVFRNVPVTDFDQLDLAYKLPACAKELDDLLNAGHVVYLHCTAGVSRSPTAAAAYLHWYKGLPLENALEQVRSARNCVPLGDVIKRARRLRNQDATPGSR